MVEKIKLSQLTKSYINNHDVLCEGVHCVYRESWYAMGGSPKPYQVLSHPTQIRFGTLSELKKFIRKNKLN